jgi:AcrR family transcriptional regulator
MTARPRRGMAAAQDAGGDPFLAELEGERSEREIGLIRSTYRVIARQGGHRMSLQDIADEAGVSKGLILYHFKSKDRLLLETMRWALVGTAARIREGVSGVEDPREAIAALVDAVFIGPEQNREFYLLYLDLVEHAARVPSFKGLYALTHRIVNGMYAEVIREGVDRGVLAVRDVDDAAAAVRAHTEGTFLAWLQEDDWEESHARYKQRCRTGVMLLLGLD